MKTKNEIRHAIRVKRAALTLEQIDTGSKAAIERLGELPELKAATNLACYLAKPFEIQTQRFIEACLTEGKRVCVPRHIDDQLGYAWSWVTPASAWRDGPWHVAEPAHEDPVDTNAIELAIVPAVALDKQGNRVGHGGGNFDRLLAGLTCLRVGMIFDFQLLDYIPMVENDVAVNVVITESNTYAPKL